MPTWYNYLLLCYAGGNGGVGDTADGVEDGERGGEKGGVERERDGVEN